MITLPRRKRPETGPEMLERIRAEISKDNKRNLSNPDLYLNRPHMRDGSLKPDLDSEA